MPCCSILTEDNIQKVKELYDQGLNVSAIESSTGISKYYIKKIINNETVPTNGKTLRYGKRYKKEPNNKLLNTDQKIAAQ